MHRLLILSVSLFASASTFADNELLTCREIKNPTARVACYDRVVDARYSAVAGDAQVLPHSESAKTDETVVQNQPRESVQNQIDQVARHTVRDEKTEAMPLEPIDSFGKPKITEKKREEISAVVTQIQKSAYKKLIVTLDNNQVWVQIDSARMLLREDDKVTIRTSSFNSYQMRKSSGGTSIRVKRLK